MNDLVEFCEEHMVECSNVINPLLEKYGCKSTMYLLNSKEVSDADFVEVTKALYRRDAFATIANKINFEYVAGIREDEDDLAIKRRMVYAGAEITLNEVSQPDVVTIDRMDGMPTSHIVNQSIGCIMAGNLEMAILGLSYALYQEHFDKTNRSDQKLEELQAAVPPNTTPVVVEVPNVYQDETFNERA